jgi:hypothetical protein
MSETIVGTIAPFFSENGAALFSVKVAIVRGVILLRCYTA